MKTIQELEIKNLSELINPSLDRIIMMSKSFRLTEFYELEKKIAVIAITPKQVVIAYAPTFINDDSSNQESRHYVTHYELSQMIKKKIYDTKNISVKNDPRLELHCYTDKIGCFCHPHFRQSNIGHHNVENLIITQSMINVIQNINNILFGMEREIDFYILQKYGRINPYQIKKIEESNLAPENHIGVIHGDFIEKLEHERSKVNMILEDFER